MTPLSEAISSVDVEPVVILTGAGISAESDIPTFRGENGIWKSHRVTDLATQSAFERNPRLVWGFYQWRRKRIASSSPNPGHETLVAMENELEDFTLITQNVDGLHQRAGSKRVIELHGSIWELICTKCEHRRTDRKVNNPSPVPLCGKCGNKMRPAVVWFGERLDDQILLKARERSRRAKTMLVIGTSALVQPANSLPIIAKKNGAHLIEVNPETTPLSSMMNERLAGPSGEMLPRWWKRLRERLLDPDENLSLLP